jgi:hypothetical protein
MEAFLREVCDEVRDTSAPLPPVTAEQSDHAMAVAGRHGMRILDPYDPAVLGG